MTFTVEVTGMQKIEQLTSRYLYIPIVQMAGTPGMCSEELVQFDLVWRPPWWYLLLYHQQILECKKKKTAVWERWCWRGLLFTTSGIGLPKSTINCPVNKSRREGTLLGLYSRMGVRCHLYFRLILWDWVVLGSCGWWNSEVQIN